MAKGSIVVSLRSKGLPSFNKALLFDIRYQAVQFATELLDIFLAVVVTLACLSWSSWISITISIASIAGIKDGNGSVLDMAFAFFMYIILPLLMLLLFVFARRERALSAIADLKASFVALLLSRPGGGTQAQRAASDDIHRKAVAFMDDLYHYLQHRRPYARHFYLPYRTASPAPTDELLKVSRELGLLLRRVHRGVRDMHLACSRLRDEGASELQVANLVSRVEGVHAATERLINVKEMRTPVVLRATIRWFVIVLMPVAFAPFWRYLSVHLTSKAFAGILGVLTNVALMSIADTVVALEDPFDDSALDAISLFELLDQIGVMTTPAADVDGYDTLGLGAGAAASQDPSPTNGECNGAHLAMFVASCGGAEAAAAPGGAGAGAPGNSEQAGLAASSGLSSAAGGPSDVRASATTMETVVGPPSAMDGYGGVGAAGGGGGMPSVSWPLPDVVVP
ncbi:hypothetical protein TSOC_004710, partial [Tetrabaena socialis]